jgi:hypothetical protein
MSLIRKLRFEAESTANANGPVATHPTIRKFLRRKIIRVLLLLLMITTATIPALPVVAVWVRTHLSHTGTATLMYGAAGASTVGAMGI